MDLTIFGQTFTNVAGIKATNTSGTTEVFEQGDEEALATSIVDGTASIVSLQNCTSVLASKFRQMSALISVSMPLLQFVGSYAFYSCSNLTTFYSPNLYAVLEQGFRFCSKLQEIRMSHPESEKTYLGIALGQRSFGECVNLKSVYMNGFRSTYNGSNFIGCQNLRTVVVSVISKSQDNTNFRVTFGAATFSGCVRLEKLIIDYPFESTTYYPAILMNASVFYSTPISTYTTTLGHYGSIYLPSKVYSLYTSATNWATFSARMVSYTDISSIIT